ncbi:MAG TPA: type II CAAX endopeptidase family protein [Gammaproteobacteria bacterium]|nr:type II CAAX endopeptidase family protein [Gammaproteobacteria bacterium]
MDAIKLRLKQVFLGPGGVRAGWRFAVFAALWFAWGYVSIPLMSLFYDFSDIASYFTPVGNLVSTLIDAAFMLLVSVVLVRIEKHRISWFGLGWGPDTLKLFGIGCLWGFAMVTLLLLAAALGGQVSVTGLAEHGGEFWKYLALWFAGMLLVGVDEELQLRGYPLAVLTRGIGFWPAAVILSILVGAEHLSKPLENVPDILNIVLFGLFCCYTVRRTGSLWLAIGFHAAFDFFALSCYGSPNTGANSQPLEHHLLDTHIAGPVWLTGGPQGLEASWLVPPLLAASFLLIHRLYPEDRYPHD